MAYDSLVTEICRDIRATADGGCLVQGDRGGIGGRVPMLFKLDAGGAVDWQMQFVLSSGQHNGFGVDVTELGGIVLASTVNHSTRPGVSSLWLKRLESDGSVAAGCPEVSTPSLQASDVIGAQSHELLVAAAADLVPFPSTLSRFPVQSVQAFFCESCTVPMQQYGQGTVGSGGFLPVQIGIPGSCDGSTTRITQVRNGLGGAPALLLVSLTSAQIPFNGGELLVDPTSWVIVPLVLSGPAGVPGAGELDIFGTGDITPFLGNTVHTQFAILDGGAFKGIALTNGLANVIGN